MPEHRRWAPSVIEATEAMSCGNAIDKASLKTNTYGWRLYLQRYSGVLYATRGDSTLAGVEQYNDGCPAGSWYSLDAIEQVTKVTDYAADNTHRSYWYDAHGRLTYSCQMSTSTPAGFDRIFGGNQEGACWAFDSLGRLSFSQVVRADGEQTMIDFYPNGQMAERRWHSDTAATVEQWCPAGKRIGYTRMGTEGRSGTALYVGQLMQWSVAEYSYYLVRMRNERISIRRIPGGLWKRYTKEEYRAIDQKLGLRQVLFNEAWKPAELPCRLPRR